MLMMTMLAAAAAAAAAADDDDDLVIRALGCPPRCALMCRYSKTPRRFCGFEVAWTRGFASAKVGICLLDWISEGTLNLIIIPQ